MWSSGESGIERSGYVWPARSLEIVAVRFAIIGGGPAGNTAATVAASLGAEVTLIERNVVGGAAHLWDCIPSKAMVATGNELTELGHARSMGLDAHGELDVQALRERVASIERKLCDGITSLLESQGVRLVRGTGRLTGAYSVAADTDEGTEEFPADAILLSTGSRPRIPDWAEPDGERILDTRQAYPPPEIPEHLVVIGSGVTGVEFTHMFEALGSKVTLVVSRQQVLPLKDAEVAAVLENEFLQRGVKLLKGARATGIVRDGDKVFVACDDGRRAEGSHAVFAIGFLPNSEGLGCDLAGVTVDERGFVPGNRHCQTNVPHIYSAGDLSGRLPLSSVAAMQGRKIAEHVMGLTARAHRHLDYDKAASAIFTDPEIADVGIAEAEAFAAGRKLRVTKVPFSSNPKALINADTRGFVKILSDPATGVVLGGSIVGRNAAELISVIAVAVTNNLKVGDIVDSLLVHPALAESLAEAAY
jgi:dihydrolipoamide dehydrogenase